MAPASQPQSAEPIRALPPLVLDTCRRVEPGDSRVRLRDLGGYRSVLRIMAIRDLSAKYKQSLLGPAWLIIQPAALLGALIVGFSSITELDTSGTPYALFALTGLASWSYFQAAVTMGTPALVSNVHLVKFTAAPRLVFPMASLLATLPTLVLTSAAGIIWAAATGDLSLRSLLLPAVWLWLLALTGAATLLTSALAVSFRDVINVLPFILQLGIFLVPVGYPLSELSDSLRTLLELNPLTGVIESFRWALLDGYEFNFRAVAAGAGITAASLVVAWRLFVQAEVHMADVI